MRWFTLTALVACNMSTVGTDTSATADAQDTQSTDDAWWSGTDDTTTSTSTDSADTGGWEEDDGAEELEKVWYLTGSTSGDTLQDVVQGFFFFDPAVSTASARCDLEYEITSADPTTDCTSCTKAWTFTRGTESVYEDDGGCTELNALGLTGSSFKAGVQGETMYLDDGSGWREAGYAEVESGEIFMEIWLGPEDDEEDGDEEEED